MSQRDEEKMDKPATSDGESNIAKSQYGSIDRTPLPKDAQDFATSPGQPPKPAIRQRTSQQIINSGTSKSQDLSSSKEGTTDKQLKAQPSSSSSSLKATPYVFHKDIIKPTQEQQEQREALHRELVEFNKSLVQYDSGLTQRSNINRADDSDKSNNSNEPLATTKSSLTLPLPTDRLTQLNNQRPYPKKVLFIVANEFCERFSYYGLRTVLVLYFKSVFGFTDAHSTISFHLFATLCYLTPILGAILGDSVWGKFKTIFYLSIVYFFGELVLLLSSIFWDKGLVSIGLTFFGLFMIGIGTGGIKPCVSALGGDQFLPHEDKWRQGFFSLFYASINMGSLLSMFLTPMLRSEFGCVGRLDCYPYAFGVPCILMFVAIVVFIVAKNQYTLVPLPEKNVIVAFCQCVWLALRRRFRSKRNKHPTNSSSTQKIAPSLSDNTSSSSLSVSDHEDTLVGLKGSFTSFTEQQKESQLQLAMKRNSSTDGTEFKQIERVAQTNGDHWLYLASDRFDSKSIEDFRSVLSILLLFVPLPVYWCLFDQQGSLWTFQATRMDGRIFGNVVLQPDQIGVVNPVFLISLIPIFELIVYPSLGHCNILKKPLQRITAGGAVAALAFVVSAMIEVRIQQFTPPIEPLAGRASLLIVNGLGDCSIAHPEISYVQVPGSALSLHSDNELNNITRTLTTSLKSEFIKPLGSKSLEVLSANQSYQLNNYRLKFKLTSNETSQLRGDLNSGNTFIGCPFDPKIEHDFSIGPLADKSVRLLYIEQGNGKLAYKIFNESLGLPPPGKARIRLLYEFFGSSNQAEKRHFSIEKSSPKDQKANSNSSDSNWNSKFKFNFVNRDGQVLVSDYLDVDVPVSGEKFKLTSNDNLVGSGFSTDYSLVLEPGTRNLIIVNQRNASSVEIKHELLQDNNYRINMLYQLVPYLLISISEVMFSITGLEFSYASAPESMKSVILGAWSLTIAFGNILTVAVESIHFFDNVTHDFLFYATIMALDMLIFAIMGRNYRPYKVRSSD